MPLLGCIADDFTGATDLASMLVNHGMRTLQVIGVPRPEDPIPDADALVVALKSRTAPREQAVSESLAALAWLFAADCTQFFQKYCSTFDSTNGGNIGPVADALITALGCGFALACPALPANGRTVYQGHLFVGSALLNESGMEHHPLTPMTDANLVRVLGRQSDGTVALVPFATVEQGPIAIRRAMTELKDYGHRYAVVDALTDRHLADIGEAAEAHRLITGGSGVAIGLPENFRRNGSLPVHPDAAALPSIQGGSAVLAGSCSRATLQQIEVARGHMPILELDPLASPDAEALAAQARTWLQANQGAGPILIAASAPPPARGGAAGTHRPGGSRTTGGAGACVDRAASRAKRRAPADRGGRRDIRRGSRGTPPATPAHRACHRCRGALDLCAGGWRGGPVDAAGTQKRQFRRAGFFCARVCHAGRRAIGAVTESETRQLMTELAASLFARGFSVGSAGNISARAGDGYLITPTNSCLGRLDSARIARLDAKFAHVAGDAPSKEVFMHRAFYTARPEIGAVVHLHSTMATAVACLPDLDPKNPIPPLTPYFVMRIGRTMPVIPYFRPGDPDMEPAIHSAACTGKAVLLANHGPVVSGRTLTDAVYAAEELEEAARLFLLLRTGRPQALSPEQVDDLLQTFG